MPRKVRERINQWESRLNGATGAGCGQQTTPVRCALECQTELITTHEAAAGQQAVCGGVSGNEISLQIDSMHPLEEVYPNGLGAVDTEEWVEVLFTMDRGGMITTIGKDEHPAISLDTSRASNTRSPVRGRQRYYDSEQRLKEALGIHGGRDEFWNNDTSVRRHEATHLCGSGVLRRKPSHV